MIRVCMIAEHDPWEIQLLTTYVERLALQPMQAFEGQDVLLMARQRQPDVILLEGGLPGSPTCAELLRRLKDDRATRDIPVVLLVWSPQEAALALAAGAAGYLQKPITYDAFQAALIEAGICGSSPAVRF